MGEGKLQQCVRAHRRESHDRGEDGSRVWPVLGGSGAKRSGPPTPRRATPNAALFQPASSLSSSSRSLVFPTPHQFAEERRVRRRRRRQGEQFCAWRLFARRATRSCLLAAVPLRAPLCRTAVSCILRHTALKGPSCVASCRSLEEGAKTKKSSRHGAHRALPSFFGLENERGLKGGIRRRGGGNTPTTASTGTRGGGDSSAAESAVVNDVCVGVCACVCDTAIPACFPLSLRTGKHGHAYTRTHTHTHDVTQHGPVQNANTHARHPVVVPLCLGASPRVKTGTGGGGRRGWKLKTRGWHFAKHADPKPHRGAHPKPKHTHAHARTHTHTPASMRAARHTKKRKESLIKRGTLAATYSMAQRKCAFTTLTSPVRTHTHTDRHAHPHTPARARTNASARHLQGLPTMYRATPSCYRPSPARPPRRRSAAAGASRPSWACCAA